MGEQEILQSIDEEIATLQRARQLLAGASVATPEATKKKKGKLSPEAHARMSAAATKRWAARKKAKK
jgi:hypothetical protein